MRTHFFSVLLLLLPVFFYSCSKAGKDTAPADKNAAGCSFQDSTFAGFARSFSPTTLPYQLGEANLKHERVHALKMIDKELASAFLLDTAVMDPGVQSDIRKALGILPPGVSREEMVGGDTAYLHYDVLPLCSEQYVALIFYVDYRGTESCGGGTATTAVFCTFTPQGKLISSAVFACVSDFLDGMIKTSNRTSGLISADNRLTITSESVEIEDGGPGTTKKLSSSYGINEKGQIYLISEKTI